jgi:integrase
MEAGMTNAKRPGGRPRTGTLEFRQGRWWARLTATVAGKKSRPWFDLGTASKPAARRKLARLNAERASGAPLPEPAAVEAPETVADYGEDWLKGREKRGLASAENERRYFDRVWKPEIGKLPLGDLRAGMLQEVLNDAADGTIAKKSGERYSRESVVHMRATILRMLETAWREELVAENVAKRTTVPETNDVKKPRAVLSDEELGLLVAHPRVDAELKLLVILSRTIGGMRTGDLNRLDWSAFSPGFETCTFVRRKTRRKKPGPQTLDVPEVVRPFIDAWWRAAKCPTEGPVFPARRGKRAGKEKLQAKQSYADRLRRELRIAFGLLAWDESECTWKPTTDRPATPRERELLEGSSTLQPVDFHSTRRAYATALARVGVNEQTAMVLTGHSDPRVHQRYLSALHVRALPGAAVPALDPSAVASFAANQNRPRREAKPDPSTKKPASALRQPAVSTQQSGAGEEIRTLDVHLGKVALYR